MVDAVVVALLAFTANFDKFFTGWKTTFFVHY